MPCWSIWDQRTKYLRNVCGFFPSICTWFAILLGLKWICTLYLDKIYYDFGIKGKDLKLIQIDCDLSVDRAWKRWLHLGFQRPSC